MNLLTHSLKCAKCATTRPQKLSRHVFGDASAHLSSTVKSFNKFYDNLCGRNIRRGELPERYAHSSSPVAEGHSELRTRIMSSKYKGRGGTV